MHNFSFGYHSNLAPLQYLVVSFTWTILDTHAIETLFQEEQLTLTNQFHHQQHQVEIQLMPAFLEQHCR